ncbi:MAG TPA: hypothetical protein VKH42_13725 [Vicinamibacterales bacterium]|nr:hypothetical protein [Vicinamibacterales bacterium]
MTIWNALLALGLAASVPAQTRQTLQDEHAVYELLAPETESFRTTYEVSATTAGATTFVDDIGAGLEPVDAQGDGAFDMMTGAPLKMEREKNTFVIHLPRAVPPGGGQARIRIVKTYRAPKSYLHDAGTIAFNRTIGIPRGAIVLPGGYRLTDCNVPVQVLLEPDGRVRASFMQQGPSGSAFVIKASRDALSGDAAKSRPLTGARSWEAPPSQSPTDRQRLADRAHQDRDIVYFLQQPETRAFSLYHDYTESREGVGQYLNVVRTGSTVSNPSGRLLDAGDALKVDVLTGSQLKAAGIDPGGERIEPDQQVVVFRFPPVAKGQSVRLRMYETYTAPESYHLDGDELLFDRSLGRPRNSVVLPRGWYLTALSMPGVVRQTDDGLTRVDFVNGRPDSIDVLIRGKRIRMR